MSSNDILLIHVGPRLFYNLQRRLRVLPKDC